MASEKKAVDLGLLEEDDEFEEFPAEGKKIAFLNNITLFYDSNGCK